MTIISCRGRGISHNGTAHWNAIFTGMERAILAKIEIARINGAWGGAEEGPMSDIGKPLASPCASP